MKLIIDIPKVKYDYVKAQVEKRIDNPLKVMIANGVPLPKWNGRLVSEEDMLSVIMFSKLFDNAKVGEVKEALLKIPTIIEGSDSE